MLKKPIFYPNSLPTTPVSGIAMAAATIYEVRTQDIWSWVAASEPCMCGKATLAIVESSDCMMVASITEKVIAL